MCPATAQRQRVCWRKRPIILCAWVMAVIFPLFLSAVSLTTRSPIVIRLDKCNTAVILSEEGLVLVLGDYNRVLNLEFPYMNLETTKQAQSRARRRAFHEVTSQPVTEEAIRFDSEVVGAYLLAANRFAELRVSRQWGVRVADLPFGHRGGIRLAFVRLSVVTMSLVAALPLCLCCAVPLARRRTRRRRLERGLCPQCEYDLTANTSGNCPECGLPISKETQELVGIKTTQPGAGC
jgi:hypothetical protein